MSATQNHNEDHMTETPAATELAVRAQPLLPIAADDARTAMTAYQELCKAILTSDDMQRVGDREFVKRAGFQKLAAAYGVSTEIVSLNVETSKDTDGDELMVARAVVRATHPTGRHAEGDGACSSHEKRFRRGAEKIDHDLPATAVTRATNRAISNLVAFGTVSAEEAEADSPGGGGRASIPGWAAPVPDVGTVAHTITDLLARAGIPEPAQATARIGQAIFDDCDGAVPLCVARAFGRVADVINAGEPVDATATEEPTETTTQEEAA